MDDIKRVAITKIDWGNRFVNVVHVHSGENYSY